MSVAIVFPTRPRPIAATRNVQNAPMRLIIAFVLLVALPVQAQTVTDGDTLRLAGVIYRLSGIDAPESAQTCAGWPAGKLATTALQGLISGRQVQCQQEGRDRYGRAIGKCYAAGIDLGGEMVRRGWAWAFRRYSVEYVPLEELARKEGLGVHGHPCELPWDWRASGR